MRSLGWGNFTVMLAVLIAVCASRDALAVNGNLETGALPAHWIDGTDCNTESPVQVHAYNPDLFILRQSLCTNFEAPFIYLLFGEDRVLMQDTGTGSIPIRAIVDDIITSWLDARGRTSIELIVSHSHSHGDHVAGDDQFFDRPHTKIVGHTRTAVQSFFNIVAWPTESVAFELGGGRIVDVIAIPGHQDAHIALYDRRTGLLLTGDALYPGRLYFQPSNFLAYRASMQRLMAFIADKEVRHILGTHIEMRAQPGVDFPFQATTHPNEHRLELTHSHLVELYNALVAMGGQPRRETHNDFIIFPLSGPGLAAVALASRTNAPQPPVIFQDIEGLGERKQMGVDEIEATLDFIGNRLYSAHADL